MALAAADVFVPDTLPSSFVLLELRISTGAPAASPLALLEFRSATLSEAFNPTRPFTKARKGRYEPWQFDEKNHYIYCGLHRNYYQDPAVAKAIDHDKHNEPYKRRLRHGDPPPEE